MKSDVSRSTFARQKHYRDVRWQMGRVPVDADLNEFVDIAAHRVETETVDVIGQSGAPVHDAAFQIATAAVALPPAQQDAAKKLEPLAAGDFLLSAGRYYVNGVMCENDAPIKYSMQSTGDLPDAAALTASGLYLVYLDVWARHISFLDDPQIREVALGGPDTTTRQRTVWQVKTLRVGATGGSPDCEARFDAWDRAVAASSGTMAAEVDPTPTSDKPCVIPPGGGFRRQENQLYRVEIHAGGSADAGATFKWSRDNGAVVSGWERTGTPNTIRLTHPPRDEVMGFSVGHWVELTDDGNELLGTPGLLVQVTKVVGTQLTLDSNVPAGFTRNPKVRRWDGVLTSAVTTGAWIALEDGVRVRFSAGTYRTGDYWMVPARTATGDVEWTRQDGAAVFMLPQGITHHYSRLGFVDFDGVTITPHDCRRLFLPLTEIDEHDDLRLHNKHLHGKGVVCGLQVNCVGSDRAAVRVRPGHAIDCSGADILVETPARLNVVEQAKALGFLDAAGTGDVQITLRATVDNEPVFDLRKAPPEPSGPAAILKHIIEGTIWHDFYVDCLKPVTDFLQRELLDERPNDPALVSRQKKQLLTALNLLAHRAGTAPSKRLWLSEEQHAMLAKLYGGLVDLAGRSQTFCALIDAVPPFPPYPFANESIKTAFVAKKVRGVRLLTETTLAAAWSDDAPGQLHVFDLESGEMVRDLKLAGADGLAIQDATIATLKGKPVLVVASADAKRTILTILDPEANKELDAFVLGEVTLIRLEPHPRRADVLMAVERGRGVHFLELSKLASGPIDPPAWRFPAAGHLAVLNDRACATQMVHGAAPGAQYDTIQFARLRPDRDTFEDPVRLQFLDDSVRTGEDGIALASTHQELLLHVIVDPLSNKTGKRVMVVDANRPKRLHMLDLPLADDGSETGPVGIASVERLGRIVYSLSKRNQLMWTPAEAPRLPLDLTLPAQAEPIMLANVPPKGPQLIVAANRESMTLTLTPAKLLGNIQVPDVKIDAYRDAVLSAFEQLTRILAQGLKDCLCEHLLVDCPDCEPGEVLLLAKIEIRENKVYHICNFDRQEVLTFPKVKYWLSAVPIIPLLSYLIERFCCWIIAQPTKTGGVRSTAVSLTPAMALGAVNLFRGGRIEEALVDNLTRARVLSTHVTRDVVARTPEPSPTPPPNVRLTDVVDRDRTSATAKLAEKGVVIASVEDYDAAVKRGGRDLSVSKLPASLRPGESVKLYTRGDQVVFYQVVTTGEQPSVGTTPAGPDVRVDLDDLRSQLNQIRATHAQDIATRDREVAELRLADVTLNAEVRRMSVPQPGTADLRNSVDAVRTDLAAMRDSHAAELAARDRQIAELRALNERLITETRSIRVDMDRIGRNRPPG